MKAQPANGMGKRLRWRRRTMLLATLLLLNVLIVSEGLRTAGLLEPVNLVFRDAWFRFAGVRHDVKHVALVVIDEPALTTFKDDPIAFWTPLVAKASRVAREAGATVIGLDLLFSISPEAWLNKYGFGQGMDTTFDQQFREEIGSGKLVQVSSLVRLQDGSSNFLLPHIDYLLSIPQLDLARHMALSDLRPDSDSAVRTYVITPKVELPPDVDGSMVPRYTFGALLALKSSKADLNAGAWNLAEQLITSGATPHLIDFAGPPGTVPRVSINVLLQPDALQNPAVQQLNGKVVIIGGEYAGIGDLHPTPYSSRFLGGLGEFMTGSEVQANIVESLLGGHTLHQLSTVSLLWVQLLVTAAALAAFFYLTPAWGLVVLIAATVAGLGLSCGAFLVSWVLPASTIPLNIGLAYLGSLLLMAGNESRERKRITSLFGRYVSNSVVETLISSEQVPQMGGQTTEITLLFSDIRNFTTISEQLDAQEVVEFLNEYFERICTTVLAHGGTIDKLIGDAIMVQIGAPLPYPDHALRALKVAVAVRDQARDFSDWMRQRFPDRALPDFTVGVGIHTGEAVVGSIGSSQRSDYTAIGDAVNLASRIEGMTKSLNCDILISQETLDAAGPIVRVGRSESVHVKGRSQAVTVYELLSIEGD